MNKPIKNIIKNISYAFSSNLISMLISTVSILILPKYIGIREYGIWQLYLFYLSYIGFFHFGWLDGIYLRYGGISYKEIDTRKFSGQYYAFFILECIISITIFLFMCKYVKNMTFQHDVVKMICVVGVIVLLTAFSNFILQITNQIATYAFCNILGQIAFLIGIIFYLLEGSKDYHKLLYINLISNLLMFVLSGYAIKEILYPHFYSLKTIFREIYANISVGIKLLIANISSMLILGIIRFGISQAWDIETFGKISLILSISNFLMVFINSASIALFPVLKKINNEILPKIFIIFIDSMTIILLGFLLLSYPLYCILYNWLPQYTDALNYIFILFPICLFEGKMGLLISTYMKTLRQEKAMMIINLLSVVFSFILTAFNVYFHNLNMMILSISIIVAFRCIISELYVSNSLNLIIKHDIYAEIVMVIIFIIFNYIVRGFIGWLIYLGIYVIYLVSIKGKLIFLKDNLISLIVDK